MPTYNNKIIYGDQVLMDLTQDTVAADKVLSGFTAHDASGAPITGTISSKSAQTYTPGTNAQTIAAGQYLSGVQTISGDANFVPANIAAGTTIWGQVGTFSSDATSGAADILSGQTAYVNGTKVTGTMPNNGAVAGTISTKAGVYTVPNGYHDGSGTVGIAAAEQAKIIAGNIKAGVSILGVVGDYSGAEISAGALSATPYTTAKTYLPSTSGYDYFSQATVSAIYYNATLNSAGGYTVTIGQVDPDA